MIKPIDKNVKHYINTSMHLQLILKCVFFPHDIIKCFYCKINLVDLEHKIQCYGLKMRKFLGIWYCFSKFFEVEIYESGGHQWVKLRSVDRSNVNFWLVSHENVIRASQLTSHTRKPHGTSWNSASSFKPEEYIRLNFFIRSSICNLSLSTWKKLRRTFILFLWPENDSLTNCILTDFSNEKLENNLTSCQSFWRFPSSFTIQNIWLAFKLNFC